MSKITRLNRAEWVFFKIFWFAGSAAISLFDFYYTFIVGSELWVSYVNILFTLVCFWVFCWVLARMIFTFGGRMQS